MENAKLFHLFIAGGGVGGITTLDKLLLEIEDNNLHKFHRFQITICEKGDRFGPGFAYDPDINSTCLNTGYACRASLRNTDPMDFCNWLEENNRLSTLKEELKSFSPELYDRYQKVDPYESYPRVWHGYYFADRFNGYLEKAKELGVIVNLLPKHELVSFVASEENKDVTVIYKNLQTNEQSKISNVFHLFLCTGLLTPRSKGHLENSPKFIANIYPLPKLRDLKFSSKRLGIFGTNPSGIDALLEIMTANGRFINSEDPFDWKYIPNDPKAPLKVTMMSRSARLPEIRAKTQVRLGKHFAVANFAEVLEKTGHLPFALFFEMLERDLNEIYGKKLSLDELMRSEPTTVKNLKEGITIGLNGDLPTGISGIQSLVLGDGEEMLEMTSKFDGPDLKFYSEKYFPFLAKYLLSIPVLNAIRILALLKMGLVEFMPIEYDYTVETKESGVSVTWGNGKCLVFDYLCDCRGLESDVKSTACEFTRNAMKEGKFREYIPKHSSENRALYHSGAIDINVSDLSIYDAKGFNHKNVTYTGAGTNAKFLVFSILRQNSVALTISQNVISRIKSESKSQAESHIKSISSNL